MHSLLSIFLGAGFINAVRGDVHHLFVGTFGSSAPSHMTAFTLSSTGAVESQNFITATTSSGGSANAVSPSPFSDKCVAITDSESAVVTGTFVEIWQLADDASNATMISHLDIPEGQCCANAVWLD